MKVKSPKSRIARIFRVAILMAILGGGSLAGWVNFGSWPNPVRGELPWEPDAILVLGGGDIDRPKEAMRLAEKYPQTPVIVTGDSGLIYKKLRKAGLLQERIIHELLATSTMENAQFTRDSLDRLEAQRVVLVTDWFHVPRVAAIFEKVQSEREFFISFQPKPEVLNSWHAYGAKRERLAVIHNFLRHGIWSF